LHSRGLDGKEIILFELYVIQGWVFHEMEDYLFSEIEGWI